MGSALGMLGIALRVATHRAIPLFTITGVPGTTRVSPGLYNTKEDIDALAVAMALATDHFTGVERRV